MTVDHLDVLGNAQVKSVVLLVAIILFAHIKPVGLDVGAILFRAENLASDFNLVYDCPLGDADRLIRSGIVEFRRLGYHC